MWSVRGLAMLWLCPLRMIPPPRVKSKLGIGSSLKSALDQRCPRTRVLRVGRRFEEGRQRMLKHGVGRERDFVHESLGTSESVLFE